MSKTQINLQDAFLNQVRKENVPEGKAVGRVKRRPERRKRSRNHADELRIGTGATLTLL